MCNDSQWVQTLNYIITCMWFKSKGWQQKIIILKISIMTIQSFQLWKYIKCGYYQKGGFLIIVKHMQFFLSLPITH